MRLGSRFLLRLEALEERGHLAEALRASPELVGLPAVVFGLEDLPGEQRRRAAVLDLESGGHVVVAGSARSGRSTFLRTLGTSLAATVLPADAHVYASPPEPAAWHYRKASVADRRSSLQAALSRCSSQPRRSV